MSLVGAQNRGGERGTGALPEVYEQPGLEAVTHEQDWSGLQVVNDHHHRDGSKEVTYQNNEYEKDTRGSQRSRVRPCRTEVAACVGSGTEKEEIIAPRRSRRLAGHRDGRRGRRGRRGGEQDGGGAGRKGSPEAQAIRRGSSLTATGWWENTGSEANDTSWQGPDELDLFATGNSRLAGSTIVYDTGYTPQPELFYTNAQMQLLGISMNDLYNPTVQDDSIKSMTLRTGVDSSVASNWPWSIYQAADGYLVEVRKRLIGGTFRPAAEWDAKRLRVQAVNASRLALVPTSTNFSRIAIQGGYGIFYQSANSSLVALIPDLANNVPADYVTPWPTDFPSITLPQRGTFAAFSVARPSDSLQSVDTYALYLDASSNINVVYTDSSTSSSPSWKMAQPDVLKGADADTDTACLTMATSAYDSFQEEVPLKVAASMVRCCFQREVLVREVTLSGTQWVDVGSVPIS
ncbi:uncharacterized protein LY79DRAFT_670096 [Colletotrichum navitas]|uniref:Uncharacterized protein n=1 Tax=Colletotrichum navitas TaxID=681940 RepID=A0AAD8PZ04_9PEZI|nr:uncharacterized protein LY79DRAFT_670096 [Colletotrichum navitas]KAK1590168.1 hypothetical protein LY79DRAFT_670096 [Colletotrichum navitas]